MMTVMSDVPSVVSDKAKSQVVLRAEWWFFLHVRLSLFASQALVDE